MTRESAAAKARRLLVEGRVIVVIAYGRRIDALVRGDSGAVYDVLHRGGHWSCSCEARTRCSHVQAVMLVVAPVRPCNTTTNPPPAAISDDPMGPGG